MEQTHLSIEGTSTLQFLKKKSSNKTEEIKKVDAIKNELKIAIRENKDIS
jgi:hypothetical protein